MIPTQSITQSYRGGARTQAQKQFLDSQKKEQLLKQKLQDQQLAAAKKTDEEVTKRKKLEKEFRSQQLLFETLKRNHAALEATNEANFAALQQLREEQASHKKKAQQAAHTVQELQNRIVALEAQREQDAAESQLKQQSDHLSSSLTQGEVQRKEAALEEVAKRIVALESAIEKAEKELERVSAGSSGSGGGAIEAERTHWRQEKVLRPWV